MNEQILRLGKHLRMIIPHILFEDKSHFDIRKNNYLAWML